MNLEFELEMARKRVISHIEVLANEADASFEKRINNFKKAYDKAINHINFKARLAESLGWDGFEIIELPSSNGGAVNVFITTRFAEIK